MKFEGSLVVRAISHYPCGNHFLNFYVMVLIALCLDFLLDDGSWRSLKDAVFKSRDEFRAMLDQYTEQRGFKIRILRSNDKKSIAISMCL